MSMAASSSSGVQIVDDAIIEKEEEYEACSVCLEPFSDIDPATVTGCKHEYHLHCILEWSQRSKECPICWRSLALKDPVSQELLLAAGTERASRLSSNVRQIHEGAPYMNDIDYEEEHYRRPDRPSSSSIDGSRRSSSSELLSISNSIRSKFFAASTRCKESISKGTNGFKEKLLARNTTVKEFSREVQREMNAGIAGVARMIERIDLSSKRTGASNLVTSCKAETSNLGNKGKSVHDDIILARAPGQTIVLSTETLSSDSSPLASKTTYSQQENSPAQVRH